MVISGAREPHSITLLSLRSSVDGRGISEKYDDGRTHLNISGVMSFFNQLFGKGRSDNSSEFHTLDNRRK